MRPGRANGRADERRSLATVQARAAVYLAARILKVEARIAELDERFAEPAAGAARRYAAMSSQAYQERDSEIDRLLNQLRILRMQLALLPKHPPDVISGLGG